MAATEENFGFNKIQRAIAARLKQDQDAIIPAIEPDWPFTVHPFPVNDFEIIEEEFDKSS